MAERYLHVSEVCMTMGSRMTSSVFKVCTRACLVCEKVVRPKPTCYGHVALACTTSKYPVVLFYCVLFSCVKMYFLGDIHFDLPRCAVGDGEQYHSAAQYRKVYHGRVQYTIVI